MGLQLGILSTFIFFLFVNSAIAYQIEILHNNGEITKIYGHNFIAPNGTLSSNILVNFETPPNNTSKSKEITIHFTASESYNKNVSPNITFAICPYFSSTIKDDRILFPDINCSKIYNLSMVSYHVPYTFTFNPEISSYKNYYILIINYTQPNFIFSQGDYKVAWLALRNMRDIDDNYIINSLVLPTDQDIPRFIPDASAERVDYLNNTYRWAFRFIGKGDKIIWYQNDKELREHEYSLVGLGALLGLFVSIIAILIQDGIVQDRIKANKKKR